MNKKSRNFGNGLSSTGYRTFKKIWNPSTKEEINVLVAWTDRHCIKCKRFLSLRQHKYCSKCKPIEDAKIAIKSTTSWQKRTGKTFQYYLLINSEFKATTKLRGFVSRHADELEVGQIV